MCVCVCVCVGGGGGGVVGCFTCWNFLSITRLFHYLLKVTGDENCPSL